MRTKAFPLPGISILVAFFVSFLSAEVAWGGVWTKKQLMTARYMANIETESSVAVGPNGDALAVWIDDGTGLVWFSIQNGGVWSAAKKIYTPPINTPEFTTNPFVAIAGDGTAMAIWSANYFSKYLSYSVAKVATLSPGATSWSQPEEISARGRGVGNTQIGMDKNGNAVALWSSLEAQTGNSVIQSAFKSLAGGWTVPQTLSPTAQSASLPDLAVNSAGEAVAVWQLWFNGVPFVVQGAVMNPGGTWGPSSDISLHGAQIWSPQVALDGQGNAAAAWNNNGVIEYAKESLGGAWSLPQAISAAPWTASDVALAANEQGDILFAWVENNAVTMNWRVRAQMHLVNGTSINKYWGTLSLIGGVPGPSAALSPDGSLGVVAWVNDGAYAVRAATFSPSAGWLPQVTLGAGIYSNKVSLGSGPQSSARAVWGAPGLNHYTRKIMSSSFAP